MNGPFQFTPQATEDHPLMGTKRLNITYLPVQFWVVTKFPNYVFVYRPETVPLQVIAVLLGKRGFETVLAGRAL
ncbi:MAG TPA: hypothetical protein VG273_12990 [Bryobacteraceae bacterium]|nr:hypothetical protein [Bryobacteraceae bacterium]